MDADRPEVAFPAYPEITKAQWKEVEAELARGHGIVKLRIDGYEVTYRVELVSKLKLGIVTYVNGEWRGQWLNERSEEGRRFFYKKTKFMFSAKNRAEYIKVCGGRRCSKDNREFAEQKVTSFSMLWPNATALRRHLVKINKHISLVKIGYGPDPEVFESEAAVTF